MPMHPGLFCSRCAELSLSECQAFTSTCEKYDKIVLMASSKSYGQYERRGGPEEKDREKGNREQVF